MHQHPHDHAPPGANDEARTAPASAPSPKDHNQQQHSRVCAGAAQGDDRRFADLRARLALRGMQLHRSDPRDRSPAYFITWKGLCRDCANLSAVESFCRAAGVQL